MSVVTKGQFFPDSIAITQSLFWVAKGCKQLRTFWWTTYLYYKWLMVHLSIFLRKINPCMHKNFNEPSFSVKNIFNTLG